MPPPKKTASRVRVAPIRTIPPPLPLQLLRAREVVLSRFRPILKEYGLTDQQGRILRVLAEERELELGTLSLRTCIHAASLSRMIPRMHERGLLRRVKDPSDGRRVIVSITPRARVVIQRITRRSEEIYAALEAEIGVVHMRQLNRSLDALIAIGTDADALEDAEEQSG